jgi:glutamate-1-semialdehyde 2,1-aminomutase
MYFASGENQMKERKRSDEIFQSSCTVIPGGVNSPVRAFPGLSLTPLIVSSGKGDTLWDVDGNAYIDYCCSWGALILGHAFPKIVQGVCDQVQKGSSFGIATDSEKQLAQKLVSLLPHLEKVRFVSSGTEATMSAIRLSRGFTNRSLIVKFNGHYHGHVDALLIRAGSGVAHLNKEASSKGVTEETIKHTLSLPFNDLQRVSSFFQSCDDLAAVIVEPVAGNMGVVPASLPFLQMLREETYKKGALLIFDEVITGFRVGLRGAQELYGITPDLSCYGKIIGGGFPVAAFGGRKEIMDHLAPLGEVYQAGTLSGNPIAMHAGYQTLQEIEKEGFYESLELKTKRFLGPIEAAMKKIGCVQRQGSMFSLFFGPSKVTSKEDLASLDQERFKQFFRFLFERGVYIPPSPYETWFLSSAHTEEHLAKTQELILQFVNSFAG